MTEPPAPAPARTTAGTALLGAAVFVGMVLGIAARRLRDARDAEALAGPAAAGGPQPVS